MWGPLPCLSFTMPESSGSTRFVIPQSLCAKMLRDASSLVDDADGRAEQTMMGSRPRIWATMFMISFPVLSIALSTYSVAAGEFFRVLGRCSDAPVRLNLCILKALLISASHSEAKLLRVTGYLFVVMPILCGVAFLWMLFTKPGSRPSYTVEGSTSSTPL